MEKNIITEENTYYDEQQMIEEVRAKRKETYNDEEKLSDIAVTQCIVCMLIILVFVVMNIFYPEISQAFLLKYKQYTGNEVEEVLVSAVHKIVEFANSVPQ